MAWYESIRLSYLVAGPRQCFRRLKPRSTLSRLRSASEFGGRPPAAPLLARLAEVTSRHLAAMFAELAAGTTPADQPGSRATLQRIRATFRAAYNAAIREGLVVDNPARRVEMPSGRRPHAVVWTDGRVEQWRTDGARPAVAVWTPNQLATFLDTVADDPLYRCGG